MIFLSKTDICNTVLNKIRMICRNPTLDIEWRANLLQPPYYFTAIDLMYLLLEVEKEFRIRINEDDLLNYKFSSIDNISEIILHEIALEGSMNHIAD